MLMWSTENTVKYNKTFNNNVQTLTHCNTKNTCTLTFAHACSLSKLLHLWECMPTQDPYVSTRRWLKCQALCTTASCWHLSSYFTAAPGGDKEHPSKGRGNESPHTPHTTDPPCPIIICLPVNPTQGYLVLLWIDDVGAHAKVWGISDVATKPRYIMNEKPLPKSILN